MDYDVTLKKARELRSRLLRHGMIDESNLLGIVIRALLEIENGQREG